MTRKKSAAIVLAAGLGTRMKSALPKVMHRLAGRPMIAWVLDAVAGAGVERVVVVAGPAMDDLVRAAKGHAVVVQEERLGTGHAVLSAVDALGRFAGPVLVVCGDTPLVTPATLKRVLKPMRAAAPPALVVLGFEPADPGPYGRLMLDGDGAPAAIVEARDATAAERALGLCNAGIMAIDGARLKDLVGRIGNDNAKGEYYLTDIVAIARGRGLATALVMGDEDELLGVNSRRELAEAEAVLQSRLRARAMAGGATLIAPETVHLSFDTRLGRDAVIGPYVVFGPGVRIGEAVQVLPFSHIEGARIASGSRIGPFARLRPGADIAKDVRVGNFVEVKNARLEAGAKASHLAYIGDARVGRGANVGAGTITCNYDGFTKGVTEIGAGAFIGSNAALVAPVKVGSGAVVGAGSVITKDVSKDALAVTRAGQKEIGGWARALRNRKRRKSATEARGRRTKDKASGA